MEVGGRNLPEMCGGKFSSGRKAMWQYMPPVPRNAPAGGSSSTQTTGGRGRRLGSAAAAAHGDGSAKLVEAAVLGQRACSRVLAASFSNQMASCGRHSRVGMANDHNIC
jgi:hypothetical protein